MVTQGSSGDNVEDPRGPNGEANEESAKPEADDVDVDFDFDSESDPEFSAAEIVEGDVESTLSEVIAEKEEILLTLQRLQADFENYRKRVQRQESDLRERANVSLIERLLPVLDVLDLAVTHAIVSPEDPKTEGIAKVASVLHEVLAKEGLEKLGEPGEPFDPGKHEAVAHLDMDKTDGDNAVTEGDDASEGKSITPSVVEVYRSGYSLRGKVLRPAMVTVRG
ncbi:MAG: nucleotide exchange factor GrpE [Acidimicrobiales bacterium]|nr:nucleotide exchange factor GrpE [Acidimicrobiales bacterium]